MSSSPSMYTFIRINIMCLLRHRVPFFLKSLQVQEGVLLTQLGITIWMSHTASSYYVKARKRLKFFILANHHTWRFRTSAAVCQPYFPAWLFLLWRYCFLVTMVVSVHSCYWLLNINLVASAISSKTMEKQSKQLMLLLRSFFFSIFRKRV